MSSAVGYPLIGGQDCMPGDTTSGDTVSENKPKSKDKTCGYEGCEKDSMTMLDGGVPTCSDHAAELAKKIAENEQGARSLPVLSNGEDGEAAWINQDKNGNAYLSVSNGEESLNLFPDSDLLQKQLNELYEVREE